MLRIIAFQLKRFFLKSIHLIFNILIIIYDLTGKQPFKQKTNVKITIRKTKSIIFQFLPDFKNTAF